MKKFLLAVLVMMSVVSVAFARDGVRRSAAAASNTNKLGLGFNSQLSARGGINSLSLRYWGSDNIGFEGLFGFSFGDNVRFLDLGGKVLLGLKKEQNMNLYGFGLIGIENWSDKRGGVDQNDTDVTVAGGLGVEFFFQGLPNLAFGTEIGLGYNSGAKTFGTFGHWIPTVGMRYYF